MKKPRPRYGAKGSRRDRSAQQGNKFGPYISPTVQGRQQMARLHQVDIPKASPESPLARKLRQAKAEAAVRAIAGIDFTKKEEK